MKFQKFQTEGTSEALGIRRNDYIAAIRHDISEVTTSLGEYQELKKQAYELLQYCKDNKLRKFKKVVKKEIKILNRKNKWHKRYKKQLEELLVAADRYAPGAKRE